jgi:catechol 2,3-dioxygenase-like lactoylglutathione lyase family enzyme
MSDIREGAELVAFLGASDLARSDRFYAGALGLELVERTDFANVYLTGRATLRVTHVEQVAPAPYTVLGWNVNDIRATIASLTPRGVAFTRYDGMAQDGDGVWRSPGGALVVWFRDPDANTLSLTQPPMG